MLAVAPQHELHDCVLMLPYMVVALFEPPGMGNVTAAWKNRAVCCQQGGGLMALTALGHANPPITLARGCLARGSEYS